MSGHRSGPVSASPPDVFFTLGPGSRVREYQIVRRIASGGFGDVYEAYHPVLARRVALKILQAHHAEDVELERQFLAEGRILARIRSPHVVAVYDADTSKGRAWIAMELLEGRTLREVLSAEGRLPVVRALDIAARVAAGARALHERDIVHRDLKPENIFVTTDGRVVVMDLGIAKSLTASGESSATHVMGTARYMSPEQIQRVTTDVNVDARSDVYALSLILYEMICGAHPFDEPETTLDALLLRQINLPPPALAERAPGVPAAVCALVHQGLEKKPECRQSSMAEYSRLIGEVQAALVGNPGAIDTHSGRRGSLVFLAATALLVVVVIALFSAGGSVPGSPLTPREGASHAAEPAGGTTQAPLPVGEPAREASKAPLPPNTAADPLPTFKSSPRGGAGSVAHLAAPHEAALASSRERVPGAPPGAVAPPLLLPNEGQGKGHGGAGSSDNLAGASTARPSAPAVPSSVVHHPVVL